ncbi:MAG: pilus assembly protein [Candidatus Eremiobacteraeota bacterium]|nr:pilus assembly protein [Candidatus Eremiobacteraeota bacterium]
MTETATKLRCDRGTSLIEFAIVAPVLVFMLIGLIEVGRYTYFAILASHAARAGVQYAAQNLQTAADASVNGSGTRSASLQDAQNLANWTVTSSIVCTLNGTLSPCPANNTNAVSTSLVYYVKVQVNGTFASLLHYPGIPNNIPVSGAATMPVGNQ